MCLETIVKYDKMYRTIILFVSDAFEYLYLSINII